MFNTLRFPLVVFPKALKACMEGYQALLRLEDYLSSVPAGAQPQGAAARKLLLPAAAADEGGSYPHPPRSSAYSVGAANGDAALVNGGGQETKAPEVSMKGVTNSFLKDVTFTATPGKVVGILGNISAGKSYLLKTLITRDTYLGTITVRGKVAYVPQVTW
jgi:ABC-type multidrug transport system fused ATPase/permease subunit